MKMPFVWFLFLFLSIYGCVVMLAVVDDDVGIVYSSAYQMISYYGHEPWFVSVRACEYVSVSQSDYVKWLARTHAHTHNAYIIYHDEKLFMQRNMSIFISARRSTFIFYSLSAATHFYSIIYSQTYLIWRKSKICHHLKLNINTDLRESVCVFVCIWNVFIFEQSEWGRCTRKSSEEWRKSKTKGARPHELVQ